MKTFVVIGLGKFGSAVAIELCRLGCDVLAIDREESRVLAVADKVTYAVTADASDPDALNTLEVGNYDCAIVAIGLDVGSSALVTVSLKEMGVPKVICKASTATHKRMLELIGADRVIIPELETGIKIAQGLVHTNLLNFIEFSEDYGIVEMKLPPNWVDKTLCELDIRAKHHLTIIAIRRLDEEAIQISPPACYKFRAGDCPYVLGRYEDIQALEKKA